jgi:hypothetical protein
MHTLRAEPQEKKAEVDYKAVFISGNRQVERANLADQLVQRQMGSLINGMAYAVIKG